MIRYISSRICHCSYAMPVATLAFPLAPRTFPFGPLFPPYNPYSYLHTFIHLRVLSALTRLMFQMVDAVVSAVVVFVFECGLQFSVPFLLLPDYCSLFLCIVHCKVKCFHNRRTTT